MNKVEDQREGKSNEHTKGEIEQIDSFYDLTKLQKLVRINCKIINFLLKKFDCHKKFQNCFLMPYDYQTEKGFSGMSKSTKMVNFQLKF